MPECQLSIIVPVYNTEKYIDRCMKSLVNQSLNNIEIIIINDGSTDNSNNIIQNYLGYNNVKYINYKTNYGLGHSRNVGISNATGKYITFVDSDDWVDLDLYKIMCNAIEKDESDIAICGVKNEWDNQISTTIRHNYIYPNIINSDQALDLLCKNNDNNYFISPVVWNKIYTRELLINNNFTFIDNSYWEDDIFSFNTFAKANKISLVPKVYYHYYHRNDSIMNTISKKHIDDLIYAFSILKNSIHQENLPVKINQYKSMFDRCICTLINMIHVNEHQPIEQKKYIVYFLEEFLKHFSINEALNYLDINRIIRLFN